MYEELIQALQLHCEAGKKIGLRGAIWTLLDDASTALKSMTAQLAALQAENGSKDREIERLKKCRHECKIDCLLEEYNRVCEKLSRVEGERDAAQKCIYDVETYLELGSGAYIAKTIQAWKNGAQGEG